MKHKRSYTWKIQERILYTTVSFLAINEGLSQNPLLPLRPPSLLWKKINHKTLAIGQEKIHKRKYVFMLFVENN